MQPQQSAPTLGTSLFGNPAKPAGQPSALGLGQSQQQNQGQPQDLSRSLQNGQAASNVRAAYFDQILERGRKRNNGENGAISDLPSLQLGLGDIARKVRNLGTGGPTSQEAKDGAHAVHQARAGDTRA
jgi:nuclear pore complex protein Nup93